jgi:outer membrane protein assembly factor BamD
MEFKDTILSRRRQPSFLLCTALLLSVIFLPACLFHRHRGSLATSVPNGAQPDKVLLQKALNEFKHGRYDVGRLTLQTLMNTYPDSEYLSQAKLAIADSYYKQGGISGLTEAEAEYKDFITFFPTAPEAPMAEYRAGMCHFRLMGKADRDQTEARQAETEFKEFLVKYPQNPLMPEVKARLREVQEVLAQGDFEIAQFYYIRGAWPAAESRYKEIVDNYPNFSQGDRVFWNLGQTLVHLNKKREAVPYYDRLIMEFPLSPLVKNAQQQLAEMHEPIPKPTRAMLARAEADAARHSHRNIFEQALGAFSSAPDFSETLHGPVVLGSPNQIQVKIAKLNGNLKTPQPSPSAGHNTLGAETASMASLNSGKPVDPLPLGSGSNSSASNSNASGKTQQNVTNQNETASSSSPPPKKQGRFHFLKKFIP